MKKFRFQLLTLLEIRQRKEDEIKLLLGSKTREILDIRNTQTQIYDQLVAYRFKLKSDLLNIIKKIDDLQIEADKIREMLTEAVKKRRAIEIIRDRRMAQWHKELLSKEQGIIDEISQQGYLRKTQDV
jgi:flagellar protein FliJ